MAIKYWTYDKCKEEALKYIKKSEFKNNSTGAYNSAIKNNWYKEITSHMVEFIKPSGYWTYDRCKEEALKYKSRFEYQKKSAGAYRRSFLNKWLDEICSHMIELRIKWTKEMCKEIILENEYKTKKQFRELNINIYRVCVENGWLKELCSHISSVRKEDGYWTYDKCKEEALKYKSRKEFKINCSSGYKYSLKNKWIDDVCSHMISLGDKYKRLIYIFKFSDNSVYIGLTNNPNERYNSHMIKTTKNNSAVYKYFKKTNLVPEFIILSEYLNVKDAIKLEIEYIEKYKNDNFNVLNKRKGGEIGTSTLYWTYDKCKLEAEKYQYRKEFCNNSNGAYNSARKRKWLDEFFPNKRKSRNSNIN